MTDLTQTLGVLPLSSQEKAILFYKEIYRSTRDVSLYYEEDKEYIICKKICCRKKNCPKTYIICQLQPIPIAQTTTRAVTTEEIEATYKAVDPNIRQQIKREIQTCSALRRLSLETVSNVLSKGEWIPARLIKVIDGDTISVAVMVGGEALKVSVRIYGIDCPEKSRASEKEIRCSNVITAHLKGKLNIIVRVKFLKPDKWGGRWLGYVQYNTGTAQCDCGCGLSGVCLGQYLLSENLAKSYKGEKKSPWTEQELDCILSKF